MAFIEVQANLSRVADALERIAQALEAMQPVEPPAEAFRPVRAYQIDDREEARAERGGPPRSSSDTNYRYYGPRN